MKMQTSERSDSCLTFLYEFEKWMKKSRCFSVEVLFGWRLYKIKGIITTHTEESQQNLTSSPGFSLSCLPETSLSSFFWATRGGSSSQQLSHCCNYLSQLKSAETACSCTGCCWPPHQLLLSYQLDGISWTVSYTLCNLVMLDGVSTSESNTFLFERGRYRHGWHQNNSGNIFPANSVPQCKTRPLTFSTAQKTAGLTPWSAENWVHFMSIGHEAASEHRSWAQAGDAFPVAEASKTLFF